MGNIKDELIDVEASLERMGMSPIEAQIEAAAYRLEAENSSYDSLVESNCEVI